MEICGLTENLGKISRIKQNDDNILSKNAIFTSSSKKFLGYSHYFPINPIYLLDSMYYISLVYTYICRKSCAFTENNWCTTAVRRNENIFSTSGSNSLYIWHEFILSVRWPQNLVPNFFKDGPCISMISNFLFKLELFLNIWVLEEPYLIKKKMKYIFLGYLRGTPTWVPP